MNKERDPVFAIRMPADLKAHLEKAAEEGHRSLTAEILLRLSGSLSQDPDLEARVSALEEEVAALKRKPKRDIR